jgi:hypothetical protein
MIPTSRAWARIGGRCICPIRPLYAPVYSRVGSLQLRRVYESTTAKASESQAHTNPTRPTSSEPENVVPADTITTPNPAAPAAEAAKSLPTGLENQGQKSIPGSIWLRPFRAYGRVHQRKPYWTQFVSALVIYLMGDFVAQSIGGVGQHDDAHTEPLGLEGAYKTNEEDIGQEMGKLESWFRNRDWQRTLRALLIGGIAAVPGYKWFLWLSNSFNYRSKIGSLGVKVCPCTPYSLSLPPQANSKSHRC